MTDVFEVISRENARELASVEDRTGTKTTVYVGTDGTFRILTLRGKETLAFTRWCRTRAELLGSLRGTLEAGDFALLAWRLLGKAF